MMFISHKEFDVLLTDVDEKKLFDLGADSSIEHLASASFPNLPFPAKGRVHGVHKRLMVPLICRYSGRPHLEAYNVWFIVALGSPYTYLSVRSLETIIGQGFSRDLHTLAIQDPSVNIVCRTSHGHFANVNLLGMDAIRRLKLSIDIDWNTEMFQLIQK